MEPKEAIATPPHSGAIEAYGIEPIPEALKTVRWPDLFLLVSNFLVNPWDHPDRRPGRGFGSFLLGHHSYQHAGHTHRFFGLYRDGHGRGGLWHHGASGLPHGLRHPRSEVVALDHAHHRLGVLVRHANHCGRDGVCRHRAPVDGSPLFRGAGWTYPGQRCRCYWRWWVING